MFAASGLVLPYKVIVSTASPAFFPGGPYTVKMFARVLPGFGFTSLSTAVMWAVFVPILTFFGSAFIGVYAMSTFVFRMSVVLTSPVISFD